MTSRDFVYWLQGFFEISQAKEVTEEQVDMIKKHLNMVFIHEIDPSMGDEKHQQLLNEAHEGKKPTGNFPPPPHLKPNYGNPKIRC